MKKDNLVRITEKKIVRYIVEQRLQPGEQLPTETDFLRKLSVSRGTLREAFKILMARNVLEIHQGAGTFMSRKQGVADDPFGLSLLQDASWMLQQMLDVRLMIEPRIAELATLYATDLQKNDLSACVAEMENAGGNRAFYVTVDERFHRILAEACGNCVLSKFSRSLQGSIEKNIKVLSDEGTWSTHMYGHKKIFQAVLDGDMECAKTAMMMHLYVVKRAMHENKV